MLGQIKECTLSPEGNDLASLFSKVMVEMGIIARRIQFS